ncbi:MAG: tetratricopeptide repeat protein [Pirellulales bacterium]
MIRWSAAVLWSVVLVALSATPAFAQLDKVFGPKGVPASGTITAVAPDKITVDVGGSPREFQVNEVVRVVFGDEPAELTKARDAILQGQVEAALEDLKTIKADAVTRDLVRADVEYFRAYCLVKLALAGGGNPVAADEAMFTFVRNNRTSFHVFDATELLGNLALAQGKYEDAAKRFAFLAKAPWADYRLRANVNEARALSQQKKFAEALEKYEAIIGAAENTPEANRQKLFAQVGKALCLAETGKADEGVQLLEKIIKDNDAKDSALFARAYVALGNCHLKANRSKEALLAFLHVDLMFNGDGEAHAEALYHLSKLFTLVNKSDRAVAARNLLKERYGGSTWAKAN